jgi:hypothetical protein
LSIPAKREGKIVACPKCASKLKVPYTTAKPTAPQAADPFEMDLQSATPFEDDPLAGFEAPLATPGNIGQIGQPVRPVSRKSKARRGKSKSSFPLMWVLLGCGAAFALILVAGILFWFMRSSRPLVSKSYIAKRSAILTYHPQPNSVHVYDVKFFLPKSGGNWNFEVQHRFGQDPNDPTITYFTRMSGFEMKGNDAFDDSFALESEEGQFQLTEAGHAIGFTPVTQLPYHIGPLVLCPLVTLDKNGADKWRTMSKGRVNVATLDGVKNVNLEMKGQYNVSERNGEVVTIKESRSLEPATGESMSSSDMNMKLEGTHKLNNSLGVIESSSLTGMFTFRVGPKTEKIPFTLSVTRR